MRFVRPLSEKQRSVVDSSLKFVDDYALRYQGAILGPRTKAAAEYVIKSVVRHVTMRGK